ncbi:MAG: hypothetical protein WBX01_03765 [Nitrososphaeraceae archaeon]
MHARRATIIPIKNFRYGFSQNTLNASNSNANKKLDDVLESIAEDFEKFEIELQTQTPELRKKLLGIAVCKAVNSDNPTETMNKTIKSFRGNRLNTKMLSYAYAALDLPPLYVREMLESLI